MKIRIGNACWHAGHVTDVFVAQEVGFFAEEGLDTEIVSGKIYNEGIKASRESYRQLAAGEVVCRPEGAGLGYRITLVADALYRPNSPELPVMSDYVEVKKTEEVLSELSMGPLSAAEGRHDGV